MTKQKLGGVMRFEIDTTHSGWKVTSTHRSGAGGISPMVREFPDLQSALTYLDRVVETYGVER